MNGRSPAIKLRYGRKYTHINVSADCLGFRWKRRQASCGKHSGITNANFTISYKMTKCSPRKRIKVLREGSRTVILKIIVSSICSCKCEASISSESRCTCNTTACPRNNGKVCGGPSQGRCDCGVCVCKPGYTGDDCQVDFTRESCIATNGEICNRHGLCIGNTCICNRGSAYSGPTCETCQGVSCGCPEGGDPRRCFASGQSEACSGRGTCSCGECECHTLAGIKTSRQYSGQYCECDDYSCDYSEGLLCGGIKRGRCRCGHCMCKANYSGSACGEDLSTDQCVSVYGDLCGGHGTCRNNRCTCEGSYRGRHCEDCPTCAGKCVTFKPCVQCIAYQSGPLSPRQCVQQCRSKDSFRVVDKLRNDEISRQCRFTDEDGCMFHFSYEAGSTGHTIRVERTKECPRGG